jgi:competence protein ComEA
MDPTAKGVLALAAVVLVLGLPWQWFQGVSAGKPEPREDPRRKLRVEVAGVEGLEGIYEVPAGTTVGGLAQGLGIHPGGHGGETWWEHPLEDLSAVVFEPGARPRLRHVGPMSVRKAFLLGAPMDLNRATTLDLTLLPGVGPATARKIVKDRQARGPFPSAADLGRVRGVPAALVERLRPLVSAGSGAEG